MVLKPPTFTVMLHSERWTRQTSLHCSPIVSAARVANKNTGGGSRRGRRTSPSWIYPLRLSTLSVRGNAWPRLNPTCLTQKAKMKKGVDECLLPYLHSTDEADQQQHLAYLVNEVATPIIERVLHRAFQQDHINDAYGTVRVLGEDAVADVVLKILQALLAFKDKPIERAIIDFRGFVATTAYRALTDQLREHYRDRANHEQKIRRLLA